MPTESISLSIEKALIDRMSAIIKAADAMVKELDWVRQTVHKAHHRGPLEGCPKNTCEMALKSFADYEKVRKGVQ